MNAGALHIASPPWRVLLLAIFGAIAPFWCAIPAEAQTAAVRSVRILSSPENGNSYATGDTITVRVLFTRGSRFTVDTASGTPYLALGIGSQTRHANFRNTRNDFLQFRYVVQATDHDGDGISIAADALKLNGGSIADANGNASNISLGSHAIANSARHAVNDTRPSFGTSTIESKLYDTNTAISPIALPTATGGDGTLTHALSPTSLPVGLTYRPLTRTIVGTPTTATAISTYAWKATDGDGDAATLTFSLQVWAPAGPAVIGRGVLTDDPDSNYQSGDVISPYIIYPEKVTVTGVPQLTLVIGSHKRKAAYTSASTSLSFILPTQSLLVFQYTVRADDFDGDGLAIPADALILNGGTIRAVGNRADTKLSLGPHAIASGDATSVKMRVRDTRPSFSQSASAANRSFALNVATSTALPTATGGDGALTYSVSPALPRGLLLGSASPSVTGTPTVSGTTTHTLTATDADGDRATLGPFTVAVAAANAPKPSALSILQLSGFDGDYAAGEVIRVIVSFDKGVTVTGTPQLALTIGTDTRQVPLFPSSLGPSFLYFKYTVTASDFDGDGISIGDAALTLNGGTIRDASNSNVDAALDLNAYAITDDDGHTVNDTQPSFSTTVSPKNYPANVAVDESLPAATGGDGTLRYTLTPSLPAGLSFDATRHRIHGTPTTRTARATYTYTATDGDGDAASRTFSLAVTTVPAVTAVTVRSSPASGDTYGALETISVDVQFDQAVEITAPNPSLALTIGTYTRNAAFASKPNASTLRFSYQVQGSDDDDDGIGIAAGALTLNGTGKLRDASGTRDANLALGTYAIATATGHKVDTPPFISGVAITSRPTDGNYAAGDVIAVRLTFTEPVSAAANLPTLALTIGTDTRTATWHSATPPYAAHTFAYTVTSSDFDGDGISIAAGAVTANGGFRAYGRNGDLAQVGLGTHAIANDPDHTVRDSKPAFGNLEAQHFTAGTAVNFALPTATGGDGTLLYTLSPSSLPDGLSYSATTRKITGTPTTQAIGPATAYTWTATDEDGDATPLSFSITVAAANAPRVTEVSFRSTPRAGSNNFYVVNSQNPIVVGIKFNPSVTITGTPQLALTIGDSTRQATYIGSFGSYYNFQYFVQASDLDTDGITIGNGALTLNGGRIVDASNVAAALGLGSHAITNDASHKVNGNGTALPVVVAMNITSRPVSGDTYLEGEIIRATVRFSAHVRASSASAPQLALTIGDSTRQATRHRSSSNTLKKTFILYYTVTKADYDTDGISIAANALTLPTGATLRDANNTDARLGLGSHAITNSAGHKISTPPKITGVSVASTPQQANTYTRGGTIKVRVAFDQTVTATGSPELALAIGTYTRKATATQTRHPQSLDFTYTVVAEDADSDGISIAVTALTLPNSATIRDAEGEDAVLGLGGFATTRFAAARVDGSKQGQWPDFGSATGPDLALEVGTAASHNLPTSSTGDAPLTYTVSPSLPRGVSVDRRTAVLSGTPQMALPSTHYTLTVTDANGEDDTLPFTVLASGESPAIIGVSLLQTPLSGDTYANREEIAVSVRFDKAVSVSGMPQLALTIGSNTRQAAYASASGATAVFRYVVQSADRDADGISIAADALTLNSGTIRNRANSHNAVLGLGRYALGNQARHKVDGSVSRAFQVAGLSLVSRPQNTATNTYSRDEIIRLRVRFNQRAAVSGSPSLVLTIGSNTRYAIYKGMVAGSNTTLSFDYVVKSPDRDSDGISIAASALTLPDGATIQNADGTNAQLGLGRFALGNQSGHKVDGRENYPAVITDVSFTSSPSHGSIYKIGASIAVQVEFSKEVWVKTDRYTINNNGFPFLELGIGSATRRALNKAEAPGQARPDLSTTHTFRYTVVEGDYDSDGVGIAANALKLNLGNIVSDIVNGRVDANLNLGNHAISAATGHKVDGRRPTVTDVRISSSPHANGEYIIGESITASVSFSQPVKFSGSPQLALSIGNETRQAGLTPGQNVASGRSTLQFTYAVQAGDADSDGISIATGALSGSIVGAVNDNAATLGLGSHAVTNASGHKVDGRESRLPSVTAVAIAAPQYNNSFDVHEYITASVRFSVPVNVSGSPQLALAIGSATRQMTYVGSEPNLLWFRYTVSSSDRDSDGISIADNALTLNGGSIRATHTNGPARLSVGNRNFSYRVDGSVNHPALIKFVNIISRPHQGQTYSNGERIRVSVIFGKPVRGSTSLKLTIGNQTRSLSGGFTTPVVQWEFDHIVQSPDVDIDGISIPANPLSGGTIQDAGGQAASRTFSGLGNQSAHKVDYRVDSRPVFRGVVVPALRWTVGEPVRYQLPAASGEGTLTYAMPTSPPDGLTFTPSTRTIAGTPTRVTPQRTYEMTATDSDNDTGTLRFTIEIVEDSVPTFGSTFPAQRYVENVPISPAIALPVATGGNGALTYALSGPGTSTTRLTLPAGVAYNQPTGTTNGGTISGTPTEAAAAQTYKLTVTDSEGDAASLTFTIEVQEDATPAFNPDTWTAQNYIQHAPIGTVALPAATGGNGALTYALSGPGSADDLTLPAGLTYRQSITPSQGGTLIGTPTAVAAQSTYTLTATDIDGDAATLTFTVAVAEDLTPSFSATVDDDEWVKDAPITAFTLPAATGGNGALTYALSPDLPDGVSRHATTREVSGTPTVAQALTTYTWTATDADGDAASLTFAISVDARPSFGDAEIADRAWLKNVPITSFTLPAATGGDGSLTYALSPALPDGVTRNAETHVVSGTPTATAAETEYTWTATDGDDDAVSLTFDITVSEKPVVALVLTPSTIDELTSGGTPSPGQATVTATLDKVSRSATTLTVTATPVIPAVTGDFTLSNNKTLTIAAGETTSTGTVTITAVDNDVDAPDKSVTVSATTSNAGVTAPPGVTLTIADDDDAPTVTLAVADGAIAENGGVTTVTATLSRASSEATTITVTAVDGSYTVGTDATIVIAAGETSNASDGATITAVNDAIDNVGNRTVTVSGTAANSHGIGNVTGPVLTLTDDEAPPTATLVLTPSAIDESGSTTSTTVTATLNYASSEELVLTVSAMAGANAATGDFALSEAKTLTISAGSTTSSGTVTISAVNNDKDEPNKSVTVSATASGASGVTNPADATLTIADDDAQPSVSINSPSVTEGAAGATATLSYKVTLSAVSGKQVTVAYADAGTGTASSADYTALSSNVLTFAAGATSATIDVTITGDGMDEPDETIHVKLSSPTNATLGTASGIGTITDDDDKPTVSLVLSSSSISENGGIATVTATLSGASSAAVTITVSASGSDYTLSADKTLTIAAGSTTSSGIVTISAVNNDKDEPDKSVTVSGSVRGGNGVSAPSALTLAITDDEGTPTASLVLSPTSISENGGVATVTATLSGASSAAVTITVSASGSDYTLSTDKTLTIAAGSTTSSGVVTISAVNNNKDEPDKSVTVSGTARGGHGVVAPSALTLAITDDDAQPSISINSPSATEGAAGTTATLSYEVTLSAVSGKQVTVAYADAGTGTASSADYTALSSNVLTFAAGETSATIAVTITGDGMDEPDETIHVKLSSATNANIATGTGTGTITDDDGTPTLSINSPSVTEGNSGSATLRFAVSLSAVSGQQVTVAYADDGTGTATSGTDYTAVTSGTLTFTAGQTSKNIDVSVTGDALHESNETVILKLSSANNANIATGTGTGTITDDDGTPTLSINLPSVTEGNSGSTNLRFTVSLSAASGQQVTVAYADDGTGTATSGTDYTAVTSGTLTFTAGQTSKNIDVSVTGDALHESNETVILKLSSANNANIATGTGTGTITDDDGTPTLSINLPSVTEGNSGSTNLRFTVSLSAASGQQVTVAYADDGTGTATSGTDYTAVTSGTLTFTAGQTSKNIDVSVTGDALHESNETVILKLSSANNANIATGTGTGTITDDDGTPTLSINLPSVTEGNSGSTNLRFTVSLSAASGQQVTVAYADDGTGTATSGTDYTAVTSGTLTFTAGQTSKNIDVSVTGDALHESNETVILKLSSANNANIATGTGTGTITDDDGTPTLSINSPSVTEGNSGSATLRFTVSLSAASGQQVTVAYADDGTGTATSGTDYTAVTSGILTFTAGQTSKNIDVSVTGDALHESNETVILKLSSANNANIATGTGTGTITDDDSTPTLAINSPSVTEGNSGSATLRFTVSLSAASGQQVTVAYADDRTGAATSGTDYTAITSGILTFTAGQTSKNIDVSVTGDALDEPNETVIVKLSSANNATIATGTGTGTITDDEGTPTVSLILSSSSISENGGIATVTAELSGASSAAVTITVSASGSDYTLSADKTLTIAAGSTTSSGVVTILAVNNNKDEPDKSVTVSGTARGGHGVVAPSALTLAITDDDAQPSVSINSPSVTEGAAGATATLSYKVTLSAASGQQVTVAYADDGTGTATSGTDYTAVTSGTLTFTAGQTSKNIDVSVTGDALHESNETVILKLSSPSNATIATGTGTGTITDDDGTPTLSINSPSVTEGNSGSATLRFTVSLSAASGQQVTVAYADDGTGTATSGTDYTAITSGTLTFTAGQTSKNIDVSVTGDALHESNETVILKLSSPNNATIATGTGTGTITDDDGTPTLAINSPSVTEGNSGSATLRFTVSLSAASGQQVTVAYADDGTGTATSGTDYTAVTSDTLTFTAGQTSKNIDVSVTGDALDEPNETVIVKLSSANNATIATGTGTGTITDDEGTPTVSLILSSSSISENGGIATVTAELSGASSAAVTITVSASGSDYTLSADKTLTIAAGSTTSSGIVTISAVNNAKDELDKSVTVSGSVSGGHGVSAPSALTLAITDDDAQPSLSINSPSVTEGAAGTTATLSYEVTLSAVSGKQVTVAYADAGTGTASSADYTALSSNVLTFAAGETSATIDVTITGDGMDEPDETIHVKLSSPNNANIATGTGTGTITDDDGTPTLSINSPSVTEGNSGSTTLRFTVSSSAASGQQVTVAYADDGTGTATSGTDYTAVTSGTLTFTAGQTSKNIDVSVTGDALHESNETVIIKLSSPNNANIATGTGTGTITDDDSTPTLSINSPSVTEGNSGSANLRFAVSLSAASGQQVTVAYADDRTGTATSGTDYTAITSGTLTFTAGQMSKNIDVSVTGDALHESNETVIVKLSSANNATIATGTGTGTITDDDGTPTLSINSPSVTEGNSGSTNLRFTVSLSAASGQQVTVAYADDRTGTATSGTDYTAITSGILTFTAGQTSKNIDVSVTGDALNESNETVILKLSSATNATIATGTGTGTITDDDGTPTLSINSPSVTEGNSGSTNLRFTVSLSAASGQQVTVAYADDGTGTATSGTDYTAVTSGILTFTAGQTSKNIDVSVTGDALNESNETVIIKLSSANNATIATGTGTGTITDDEDTPTVSLVLSSSSISESGGVATVTATLSGASSEAVTITVSASGSDYTLSADKTLTIAAGSTTSSGVVTISAVNNNKDEPDKSVTVSGSVRGGHGVSAPSALTLAITDDEGTPTVSLVLSSSSISESGGVATVTAKLSGASSEAVTITVSASGSDYTLSADKTLTIAAGSTTSSGVVTILAVNNARDEPDKSVTVSGSVRGGNGVTDPSALTLAITDDEGTPTVSLVLSSSSISENGGVATVTAKLSGASSEAVTITVSASGSDYTLSADKTLTIATGSTTSSGIVTISAVNNDKDEPDKSVTVSGSVRGGNGVSAPSTLTLAITDDDAQPSLSINSPSVTEGAAGTTATLSYEVTLSAVSGKQVTVAYADAGTGTASSADYTALSSNVLTFAAGATSATIAVTITGDALHESNETVIIKLSSATNATIATGTGTGTITDDDGTPTLAINSPSVTEGNSGSATLRFTVSLSAVSGQQVTVAYADDGTGTATSGTDYTAITSGTLTFTAGQTSKNIDVSVTGDALHESNETVIIKLSSATNATIATGTGTGTVTDDDSTPTLSINSPSVVEGNSGSTTLRFTVSLSAASGQQVTVAYADDGTGTATSGTDYAAITSGILTFTAGQTSKNIDVSVTGDALNESNETVIIKLSSATNANIATGTGTGTITDDEGTPTVSLVLSSSSISESGGVATVTAKLSGASSAAVTITVSASGSDYTLSTDKTLTIAAGSTTSSGVVTISAVNNDKDEPDKSVTVSGSATNSQGVTDPSAVTLTIRDDDNAPSFSATVDDQAWTQYQQIAAFTLPTASGGDGTATHTLSPALPNGVSKDANHRVSGTPSVALSETTYTWAATETDGDKAELTFTISVDGVPSFGSQTIADQSWTQNGAITAFTLPSATGGDGDLSYSIHPALPDGVTKDASHRVSGTPNSALGETTYTWTATDADNDTATLEFTITVENAEISDPTLRLGLSFGSQTIADQAWTQNEAIEAFTLPAATGGQGNLSYSIDPALPDGVTKDASHRVSGTPNSALNETTYTWTATDANNAQATLKFTITVSSSSQGLTDQTPIFDPNTYADQRYTYRKTIPPVTLPAASGGDVPLTYALVPTLPNGLSFSETTRVLSGMPTETKTETTYTLTATDVDGDTANLTFSITVILENPDPPANLRAVAGNEQATLTWENPNNPTITRYEVRYAPKNEDIFAVAWTAITGSDATTTEHILTGLANGMEYAFHLRAVNAAGAGPNAETSAMLHNVGVALAQEAPPNSVPTFTDAVDFQRYRQGTAIAPLIFPEAIEGDGTLTYALTPPAGLTYTPPTTDEEHGGIMSGTPTEPKGKTRYTLTVTDEDGDEATLSFFVVVTEDLLPSFTDAVDTQLYVQNRAIEKLALPEATGGDGILEYALTPVLPAGLDRDERTIAGTPTEAMTMTEYRWIATDEDGDTAALVFTLSVAADLMPVFTDTASAQHYEQHVEIDAVTLPAAIGGDGVLTYVLMPLLPDGLHFNSATRVLSGTPSETMDATLYTLTAMDADGDMAKLMFTVEVTADLVPAFTETMTAHQFVENRAITPVQLPKATGGDGVLTYTLTPAPSAGLTFDETTRTLSGMPTEAMGETEYIWTATDEDGDTATLVFTVEVLADLVPAFTDTVGSQRFVENQAITPVQLPKATGGDGVLTYKLTPAPSAGLTFDETTRMLSGTPTEAVGETECIYTATDEDGDTATLVFTVEVMADLVPAFTDTVGSQRFVENQAITPIRLPLASGGDGVLIYTLTPAPSAGLTFDETTQMLSGIPTEAVGETECIYTATDEDGDTATLVFTVEVMADLVPEFTDTVGSQRFVENQAITPVRLPKASGGDGVLTYKLTPAPSAGLTFDPVTRTLSGMPTEAVDETECIWTATDEDGDTATLVFTVEVLADLVPAFTDTVGSQRFVENQAITPVQLPKATGGDGVLTYTLTPAPSAGLTFDPVTRTLSGMPTEAVDETECIYTATDEDGDTATLVFTVEVLVEVIADLVPVFTETVEPQRYRAGRAIAPLTLPKAAGGDGVLTYTLTPALPEGLSLDAANRTVAGTPTAPMPEAAYKWAVADADGDTAELIFTIAIEVSDRTRIGAINEAVLPELARAMRTSSLDALTGRIDQEGISPAGMNAGSALMSLANKVMASEYAIQEGLWSLQEMIGGSSFAVPLLNNDAGAPVSGRCHCPVALWGTSDFRSLSLSSDAPISWDGDLFAAHLGADMRFGNGLIAGLAGSWFDGSVAYTDRGYGEAIDGTHESRMVSAHPYLGWSSTMGSNLWATAGYGRGEIAIDDDKAGRQASDSNLRTAAAGGRVRLSGVPSSFDLKGEAWMTRLAVDDNGDGIEGMMANTQRVRLAGEGAHTFGFSSGASLTPSLELGLRFDGGDGETGAGVELGGGLRYATARLTVETTSRVLLAHAGDAKEWSAGLSVEFSPKDDGRGLSFRLQPSYGETGSGIAQLWEQGVVGSGLTGFSPTMQMDTEVGYAVPLFAGLLTPYSGFRFSEDGTRGYRFGGRMEIGGLGNVSLEGLRDEVSDAANHGVMLQGSLNF